MTFSHFPKRVINRVGVRQSSCVAHGITSILCSALTLESGSGGNFIDLFLACYARTIVEHRQVARLSKHVDWSGFACFGHQW